MDLFCSPVCEQRWSVRHSGGNLRRMLFRLERGVCVQCGLDCHALVTSLRYVWASTCCFCLWHFEEVD